jgi:4a-hydroxytetrahydrobiopterin dehydratase
MPTDPKRVLDPGEVRDRLAGELPGWELDGDAIRRTIRTAGWKASLMVATTIGHLAEVAWHHPDLHVSWGSVGVVLTSHDAGGVTERDLALARRIDEVIGWRPGDEDGPFSGTPDDPRFAYLPPPGEG